MEWQKKIEIPKKEQSCQKSMHSTKEKASKQLGYSAKLTFKLNTYAQHIHTAL